MLRLKKWLKVIIALVLIRVVLGGILLYFVHFRLNDILRVLVRKETKGQYSFKTEDYEVSIWNRTILLKNAVLSCNDASGPKNYYALKIPLFYFSMASIKNLILHNQTSVDSVLILSPDITIYANSLTLDTSNTFHPGQILDLLKTLALRMQFRSLRVQNASISFVTAGSEVPFKSNSIDFYIKNFSKISGDKNYLLSSEDIDLSIHNQFWQLPGGKHTFAFKKLHFSGANQLVELDSPDYKSNPSEKKGGFEFAASKVYFNSKQLQDIYNKDELSMDSLICFQPVMKVFTAQGQKKTGGVSSENINFYFHKLNFKYIDINEGQLLVNPNGSTSTYQARQGNFKIYNLRIRPDDTVLMYIDSCHLALNNLKFLSNDSQSVLSIKEFRINNNDLILSGAEYGPTIYNKSNQLLYFKSPLLHISHINFTDLLQKKFTGSFAELVYPTIRILNTSKSPLPAHPAFKKISNIYKILHEVNDLIDVDSFKLVKADLKYDVLLTSIHMHMHDMSATVLLDKLLDSDSLRDIRRSVPRLSVKDFQIQTPKANFQLKNYSFEAFHRRSHTEYLELHMADSSHFAAKKVYWEGLDWDLFENRLMLQMAMLHMHELDLSAYRGSDDKIQGDRRELPFLRVGRIDIDSMHILNHQGPNTQMRFDAGNICLDDIKTSTRFILWGNAEASIRDFKADNLNAHFSIGHMSFSNESTTQLKNIQYESEKETETFNLDVSTIKISLINHSTDFSKLVLDSVIVEKPVITLARRAKTRGGASGPVALPVFVVTKKLEVRGAVFKLEMENRGIDRELNGEMDILVRNLKANNEEERIIGYDEFNANLHDFTMKSGQISVKIPQANCYLKNGTIRNPLNPVFESGLIINWKNAEFTEKNSGQDIRLENFSGEITDRLFNYPEKLKTNQLLERINIQDAVVKYRGKNWNFSANSFSWNPELNHLQLKEFDIHPVLTREESMKTISWQHDYTELKGKNLELYGFKFTADPGDTSLQLRKILIDGIDVSIYKDARMTPNKPVKVPMPTLQIENIRYPFKIDSIQLMNGKLTSTEIAEKSGKPGVIAFHDLNCLVTGIGNKGSYENLVIQTTANLFDSKLGFYYSEKYGDPLSTFRLKYYMYPLQLTKLSSLTVPMGSLQIKTGYADTLYADWAGNKNAAVGNVNFYYRNLSIKMMDPKGKSNNSIKLAVMNAVANKVVLRKNNNKEAMTYFVRDPEKMVISYWIKTALNGLVSSVGITSNSKYLKLYETNKVKYGLPAYKSGE